MNMATCRFTWSSYYFACCIFSHSIWETLALQTAASFWKNGCTINHRHPRRLSLPFFSVERANFHDENDKFSNGFSANQPDSEEFLSRKTKLPTKADLYSDEEMQNILEIHTDLSSRVSGFAVAADNKNGRVLEEFGLHDMVLQTLGKIEKEITPKQAKNTLRFDSRFQLEDFQTILPNIKAIASDVDGTLLSSQHTLHPATKDAVCRAVEAAYSPMFALQYFFPATGKTRAGALGSLGPELDTLLQQSPGVFIQGLYVVNADGKVIFEKKLPTIALEEAEKLAERWGVSLVAYDGDSLWTSSGSQPKHIEEVHFKYGEPFPSVMQDRVASYRNGFHKILLMDDDTIRLSTVVRPQLEELASKLDCVVTQAVPTMLELLPAGCSKAVGVQKLCEALNIQLSKHVCAIGDAENDIEMLQLAAIGVAVGNAGAKVKESADVVLEDTNDQGGAGRAIELFGLGKVLESLEQ
jgi:Cof subfamily protein (haloacid dehalogenase superfamily)